MFVVDNYTSTQNEGISTNLNYTNFVKNILQLSDYDAVTSIGYIAYERNISRSSVPTIRRSSSSPILLVNVSLVSAFLSYN